MIDAPYGQPNAASAVILCLPCRFQCIVQKIPENRTQISAAYARLSGKFYIDLHMDLLFLCRHQFAVDQVIHGFIPGPYCFGNPLDRPLYVLQISGCLLCFSLPEKLSQNCHMIVKIMKKPCITRIDFIEPPVIPL